METKSRLKRAETQLRRQRDYVRAKCERMEKEVEEFRRRLTELVTEELTNADDGGEYSTQWSEEEDRHEPICAALRRYGTRKNIAQQSATLAVFKGDDSADGPTIQDWFDEFDALATVYQWSQQEKLIALVNKLKGAALSVYRTASDEEKRSFGKTTSELISQFKPVRLRAVQSNMFRRRTQRHGETVGDYYQCLKELYHRAFPTRAQTKDPDGEEVLMLRTAFMGGLRAELQRRLTVENQEVSLKALFTRTRYLEATHLEGGQEANRIGGHHKPTRAIQRSEHPMKQDQTSNQDMLQSW